MKVFPNRNLRVEFSDDKASALERLRRNTKLTYNLISESTDKEFIGQIDDSRFKIISSEIGWGAVCVFEGELQDKSGTVEIRINTAFKIMFSILMLLPFIGVGITIATEEIERPIGLLVPLIMGILFIRFVFIQLSFRFISKAGLEKLARIVGLTEVR